MPDAEDYKAVGNALRQQGRLTDAADCYRRAIALRPDFAEAHNNLALTLRELGHLEEAVAGYRQAIALKPAFAEAHNNLANVLKAQGHLEEAVACYIRARDLNPDIAQIHNNLGITLTELGRPDEAASCLRRALALAPDHAQTHNNLGAALQGQGSQDDAASCYRQALALWPDFPEAHNNLGNVLKEQGRLFEAASHYRRATALKPDFAQAYNNLGVVVNEQGDLDGAIACYLKVLELDPGFAGAYSNLGAALAQHGRLDDAASCYRRALELDAGFAEAHNNLGSVHKEQGRLDEAVACYRTALALKPDDPGTHNNLGMALLAQGNLAEGWAEYEWRWKTVQMKGARRHFKQPHWRGEAGEGRSLLIHAEQGFGDTLQFCRYGPMAAERGFVVLMEVQKPLVRLLRTLPCIEFVGPRGLETSHLDLHCPMLSLPAAFGTTLATIPDGTAYLHADPATAASWRDRLGPAAGLRIGLAWAGDPRRHAAALAAVDRRRSLQPDRLAPLFAVSGIEFFSLQKRGPQPPADFPLADFMAEMSDFADTAALIASLDLVISVDTAVAHLAAALGKPVWLLDRFDNCWRWLTGRRDSPWYPSLRIYRQPEPGDWDAVLGEIVHDLRRLVAERVTPRRSRASAATATAGP